MVIIFKITSVGEDVEEVELLYIASGNVKQFNNVENNWFLKS